MSLKSGVRFFYIAVILLLIATTLGALYDGGYHINGGAMAGIALASIITSFVPFFVSMYLFKKYEVSSDRKTYLKVLGFIVYLFCFPVKSWIIYLNLDLLINGGGGWAFG